MGGETREAIEAYCVAVGLVVYEWNDLHEKLTRLFALLREGDRQETLSEWYAIRSDTRQREKLRCAITETTSDRWKKSPRAPDDLNRHSPDNSLIASETRTHGQTLTSLKCS